MLTSCLVTCQSCDLGFSTYPTYASIFFSVKLASGCYFTGVLIKCDPGWTCAQSNGKRVWERFGLVRLDSQLNKAQNEPLLQDCVPVHFTHVREILNVSQVKKALVWIRFKQLPMIYKHFYSQEGQTGGPSTQIPTKCSKLSVQWKSNALIQIKYIVENSMLE